MVTVRSDEKFRFLQDKMTGLMFLLNQIAIPNRETPWDFYVSLWPYLAVINALPDLYTVIPYFEDNGIKYTPVNRLWIRFFGDRKFQADDPDPPQFKVNWIEYIDYQKKFPVLEITFPEQIPHLHVIMINIIHFLMFIIQEFYYPEYG